MSEWINVNDELPTVSDDYLVYLANGHFCIGYWMRGEFLTTGYYTSSLEVTHWMPLVGPRRGE